MTSAVLLASDSLVIRELADSEAALLEQNAALVDLVADLAFENFLLRRACERELVERIHGDAELKRIRWRQHRKAVA